MRPSHGRKKSADPKTQTGEANQLEVSTLVGCSSQSTNPSSGTKLKCQQDHQDQVDDFIDIEELQEQEVKLQEEFSGYAHRLHKIHDEIKMVNQTGWKYTPTQVEAIPKLNFFKENINEVHDRAISRSELKARMHLSMRPEYHYINDLTNAWNLANMEYQIACIHVQYLQKEARIEDVKKPDELVFENLSITDKSNNIAASVTGTDFQILFGDKDPKSHFGSNPKSDFHSKPGPSRRQNKPKCNHVERSRSFQQQWRRSNVPTLETEYPETETNGSDRPDWRSHSPKSPRKDPYFAPNGPFSSYSRSNWIVVRTDEHPEITKPRHYGPITDLSQLFKNAFQASAVYDPSYKGHDRHALEQIKVVNFNGRNLQFFQEFEKGILIKIINNKVLDWDAKFMFLMENVSGCPLSTVNVYADKLTVENFVQAIEDLWYAYGGPTNYQNTLIQMLQTADPVDIQKPETLKSMEGLIVKIFRTFGYSTIDDFGSSFLLGSVKMTDKSKQDFLNWLVSRHQQRNLKSFKQWLSCTYTVWKTDLLKFYRKDPHF